MIIAELQKQDAGPASPEAAAARTSFTGTPDVAETVADCSSGRELIQQGFADDVAIAIELDATSVVPVLTDGAFTAVPGRVPSDA
ncbi:2-phosphosulfolactate phosphatase [Streptomyces sp. NBC_01619]|uniref:2-phosphosulfolactate phosphatase n=1 Tax=Streptomyces pratisoli TaxID=3139917 RepID=A0ACC6Q9T8_9ACTN|nr:2-phosphosulfolactate phosphatase [Streptomyces sp. NBC_01619]MCX4515651.1 2-phosphosulfolactate phosphatase [Streptomyces sp. NBC_01619]